MFVEAEKLRPRAHLQRAQALGHEDSFFTGLFPVADLHGAGLESVRDAMSKLDIPRSVPSMTLRANQQAMLCTDTQVQTAVRPIMLSTASVDTFKQWIGVEDAICRTSPQAATYWPLPTRPWSGRRVSGPADFTPEECADVQRAGQAYLFGDSALVADYRAVIELWWGRFDAAVYAMDELTVLPGARLTVTGAPAIVLVSKLDLHAPGQIVMNTPCHAHIGSLRKFAVAHTLN